MAYNYNQILQVQYQRIAEDQAEAVAELEAGRIAEDPYRTTSAADRILDLDQRRMALDTRANSFISSQHAAQANRYGLSEAEQEIAHKSFSAPGVSKDELERGYAERRQKLRRMRASGEITDPHN